MNVAPTSTNGWMQIALFAVAVLLVTKPMGWYLAQVYEGRMRWLAPIERRLYRLAGVDAESEQHWTTYATSLLLFSAVSMLLTYVVLRLQGWLPFNPVGLGP